MEPDDGKAAAPKARAKLRASVIVTIAVLGLVGAAYYVFYRKQVDYYTGRDLRVISTLTAQIGGRVSMYTRHYRDGIVGDQQGARAVDPIKHGLRETDRGWQLLLRDRNGKELAVSIEEVLRPLFARRVSTTFDMVLVADNDGNVVYRFRTPPPASSLLSSSDDPFDEAEKDLEPEVAARVRQTNRERKERESGAATAITRLARLQERKGWRDYTPLKPESLLDASGQTTVRLGDEEYLLFTQPYTFAPRPESLDDVTKPLIVCGLVSAQRFETSVRAVSVSIVFIAAGAALLALCCWPFLRIALIDPSDELTITDVALIVVCTAAGACVLTLAVLDVFAYRALVARGDAELEAFSGSVVEGFADNIDRGMTVLEKAERALPPDCAPLQQLPASFTAEESVRNYPYIDSITWIDDHGQEQYRFAPRDKSRQRNVGTRRYFRDAKADRTWSVVNKFRSHDYVLEWIPVRDTHEVRTVLAKKTAHDSLPVIALSTELVDVTDAVRPPGVQLAIIEENGDVVYHSDAERIGFENFFAETDRDRALRSAVLSRRATAVKASYWGEDQSMFVRPLAGSRWTLVTFRAQRLARVLHVEAALLTIALLLLASAPYLVLYIVTLIVAPGYRAPSVWPDPARRGDYLRLCVIYGGLLFLFGAATSVLAPWASFYPVILIPAIAVLSTYLVLHRTGKPRRFAIAAALWVIANTFLLLALVTQEIDDDRSFSTHPIIVKLLLAVVAAAVAALTAVLMSKFGGRRQIERFLVKVPLRYTTLYRLCGVLLLLLCTTLPVVAFFNMSRHVQSGLLVKYAQLRTAADLEQRINRLETLNVLGASATAAMFEKKDPWELDPPPGNGQTAGFPAGETCLPAPEGSWTATLLPALYEDSIAIRPLFEDGATDDLWRWCTKNNQITLRRKVRFDVDVSKKLWPGAKPPASQQIVIHSPREAADEGGAGRAAVMLLCGAGIIALFWYAARFISARVLLIDIVEPHWMTRQPLSPSLGDHIFLVRRDQPVDDDPLRKGPPFLDVSFAETARAGAWNATLERLDTSAAGRNIRVVDFEYGVGDEAVSIEKLKWLERLLALPDRTVIVLSAFTPSFVLAAPLPTDPPPDYVARWCALLERFVIVTAEDLELRYQEWLRRQHLRTHSLLAPGEPKTWLEKETAHNPFLLRLRDELEPSADREQMLDEIGERAETYYAGLWSSCRPDEKLLLFQLAEHGLANGRNRRTLRRLIARGLVRRNPNVELFSETFRLFVIAAAKREDLVRKARAEHGNSTWESLRVPFFVIIISFLLLLFGTQKDLMTTTTAIATALTTGLPVLMKLLGTFADKRAEAAK